MPIVENIPDLSHWRTVQEFSITQAALLLAGIDPYDYPTLEHARDYKHERWKMAWGLANGMVTAIRRGVLTPVWIEYYPLWEVQRASGTPYRDTRSFEENIHGRNNYYPSFFT